MIWKWFYNKNDFLLFVVLLILGLASSFSSYSLLKNFEYNFGKNLIGVFVPPMLTLSYMAITGIREQINEKLLFKALILYCLQIVPFTPLFLQIFKPTGLDDFGRYYLYARNMIDNHTLWGGDKLYFPEAGYHYVTQPGYRYFILFELLLFKELYRYVPFINIGIYMIAVFFFFLVLQKVTKEKKLRIGLLFLVLLFSPYAIKNVLMGLPEWLTVVLLMMSSFFILQKKQNIAIVLLALVPFLRQNLLISVLLLFLMIIIVNKNKVKLFTCFIIPLLLPLYHNLYFAGKWRFFVDIFHLPFLNFTRKNNNENSINYSIIINNIIHYAGFDLENGKLSFSFLAALFLPLSTLMYFVLLQMLPNIIPKIFFLLITMSTIVPVILLGSAYYPRFEFVNVVLMLVSFSYLSFLLQTTTSKLVRIKV